MQKYRKFGQTVHTWPFFSDGGYKTFTKLFQKDENACFLANLLETDHNAVKITLTGTPLLKEERESWRVFGDYIHLYCMSGYINILRERFNQGLSPVGFCQPLLQVLACQPPLCLENSEKTGLSELHLLEKNWGLLSD